MKMRRLTQLLTTTVFLYGAASARADLIEVVPFSLAVGPSQQTIQLPQFDPVLGTLTGATLTVSGIIQYALDVFNTGDGAFSATVHDNLLFGATPLASGSTFTGTISANQMVFTYSPAALPVGPLAQTFGPSLVGTFIGTGTVPYDLSLPAVTVDQFSGATVLNVLAFAAATGNVTADYTFTPATATVPEPGTFGAAAMLILWFHERRKRRP
ncbi:MAG TPA: choice-of-anchor E domain-containing protein [Bryobacteraceae bacterium]|jgi:hypothetical protein